MDRASNPMSARRRPQTDPLYRSYIDPMSTLYRRARAHVYRLLKPWANSGTPKQKGVDLAVDMGHGLDLGVGQSTQLPCSVLRGQRLLQCCYGWGQSGGMLWWLTSKLDGGLHFLGWMAYLVSSCASSLHSFGRWTVDILKAIEHVQMAL